MYIEREGRRVAVTSAGQNPSINDYTQSCLNLLIQHISIQAPLIASEFHYRHSFIVHDKF